MTAPDVTQWATPIPAGWDKQIWEHMLKKKHKQRLIIAGALIAAEIDRITAVEENFF